MSFEFFTAFMRALQDKKAYFSFQKEMNLKAVEQTFFNSLAGKSVFEAIVLPEDVGSNITVDGTRAIRVRPIGIHDFIIPEPCAFNTEENIRRVLALHPIAYPDSSAPSFSGNDKNPDSLPFDERVVECFFKTGPQSGGKLRGLTYRLKTTRSSTSKINLDCLGVPPSSDQVVSPAGATRKRASEAQQAFKESDYSPYEPSSQVSSGVLDQLTPDSKKYVENSTRKNIKTDKDSNGKKYIPRKKTYNGSVAALRGKQLENGLLPLELFGQSKSVSGQKALFLKDVISDFDRLAQAFELKFNKKLYLTVNSYRTFDEQIRLKNGKIAQSKDILAQLEKATSDKEKSEIKEKARKKAKEAANPGTSNHGWGLAFDFSTLDDTGNKGFASETYQWMLTNAPRFGFHSPPSLRDGQGLEESWHIEWININKIWS